jgi:signal transduction histidine kinase
MKKYLNLLYRLTVQSLREFGGTGLGLTISNQILGLMGSKLDLKVNLERR